MSLLTTRETTPYLLSRSGESQKTQRPSRRRIWTNEENQKLIEIVTLFGHKKWEEIASAMETGHSAKQCREHYFLFLDPSYYRGKFTREEDAYIVQKVEQARTVSPTNLPWTQIAEEVAKFNPLSQPRVANTVKNHYHTTLKRQNTVTHTRGTNQERRSSKRAKTNPTPLPAVTPVILELKPLEGRPPGSDDGLVEHYPLTQAGLPAFDLFEDLPQIEATNHLSYVSFDPLNSDFNFLDTHPDWLLDPLEVLWLLPPPNKGEGLKN